MNRVVSPAPFASDSVTEYFKIVYKEARVEIMRIDHALILRNTLLLVQIQRKAHYIEALLASTPKHCCVSQCYDQMNGCVRNGLQSLAVDEIPGREKHLKPAPVPLTISVLII